MIVAELLVGGISTWRLTHMLLVENGPMRMFRKLREAFGVVYAADDDTQISSFKYEITTCPWCMSVWVAGVATLLLRFVPGGRWLLYPFAFSAISVFLGKWMQNKSPQFSEFNIR